MIARGQGAYLYASDGARIIDAISSWWVVTHGHCNRRIAAAIKRQVDRLDQMIFANHTHQPAEDLARALVDMTADGLDHVFYCDSGSTAVEVALKMALGYWRNIGAPRQRIVVLEHGYHGDTIGAMSVGARGVFNAAYEPLLFDVATIPFPAAGRAQATLDALEAVCSGADQKGGAGQKEGSGQEGGTSQKEDTPQGGGESVCKGDGERARPAAFIVEPLLLGAGGMLIYDPATLREMKRICERFDVLFIADEIMTGWGRTGARFACDHAAVTPDIACYGKGLTGGALPLAVTMASARIFEAHRSSDRTKTFFHSSSFTANPICCAAALENLAIWRDEPVLARVAAVEQMQRAGLQKLRGLAGVSNCRQCGSVIALDVKARGAGYLSEIGPKMLAFFAERRLLLRPLGNTIYVMPPYCVSQSDLDEIYDAIGACVSRFGPP